jgi:hypothetical protein
MKYIFRLNCFGLQLNDVSQQLTSKVTGSKNKVFGSGGAETTIGRKN